MFLNNKNIFITSDDLYILSVLNSPMMWWHNWRFLPHVKDEALAPLGYMMEQLPIARSGDKDRTEFFSAARLLIDITQHRQSTHVDIRDWLNAQHEVAAPNTKLRDPTALSSDGFVAEVKKARGRKGLSSPTVKPLREEYARTIEPARRLAAEAAGLELRLHDLVNEAYGLTPEEVRLMWDTAPPRMPIPRPPGV